MSRGEPLIRQWNLLKAMQAVHYGLSADDCIRVKTPLSLEDAQRCVADFVRRYNAERLHSAIGYITPLDKLEGRAEAIQAQRERELAESREARKALRKVS